MTGFPFAQLLVQFIFHTFIFTLHFLDISGENIFRIIMEICWVSLCLWSFSDKDDGAALKCSSVFYLFHCSDLLLIWAACSGSAFSRFACAAFLQRANPAPKGKGLLRIERLCWWSCLMSLFKTARERKHFVLVFMLGFFKNWLRGIG